MLAILFPHMYEDIKYLLPSEDTVMEDEFDDGLRMHVPRGGVENSVVGLSMVQFT